MRLGTVDPQQTVAIVAELGNNHEGDVAVARELMHAAASAGAHAVKLQAIDPSRLVRPDQTTRLAQLERFRLSRDEFAELARLAGDLRLGFCCTIFDLDAVGWLSPLVDAFKIASGDNDLHPLMAAAARSGRPVIVSAGMSDLAGMRAAQRVVTGAGSEFAALHCVSAYPTPPEAAALASIPVLKRELATTVGYSDHTLGIDACLVATTLGARIIEKHFTLRHDFSEFRDHALSCEPPELEELVRRVAAVEELIGEPRAGVLPEETAGAVSARRSLVAANDLRAGHILTSEDITWLRPADGMRPGQQGELIGKALRRDMAFGESLAPGDVEFPGGSDHPVEGPARLPDVG